MEKDHNKLDGIEEDRRLDGFEEDRERPERGKEEVQRGGVDSRQTAASVVEDSRRPERGKRRQGETNKEKEKQEQEVKGEGEEKGEVKEGGGNEEEEEEAKKGGGKKEEEGHLSVLSPARPQTRPLPQTRCHYQSASFPLTWIFPLLSFIFSTN